MKKLKKVATDYTESEIEKIKDGILKKLGRDGIAYMQKHGELPAIKLSRKELEFLKGGSFWALVKYYLVYGDRWAG